MSAKGEANNRVRDSISDVIAPMESGNKFTCAEIVKAITKIKTKHRVVRIEQYQVANMLKERTDIRYKGDKHKQLWEKV